MEQHYKTYKYFDLKEYRKWCMSPVRKMVYEFLFFGIIRETEEVKNWRHPAHPVYKKYFKNGLLVARYSQEKLGEYLELSQQSVSKHVIELERVGFIKIIKEKRPDVGRINYYVFGEHNSKWGTKDYKETYYLNDYFNRLRKVREVELELKGEEAKREADKWFEENCNTWDNIIEEEIKRIRNGFNK